MSLTPGQWRGLPSIHAMFGEGCEACDHTGHVCADDDGTRRHGDVVHPWDGLSARFDACDHGGGAPCPRCSPRIPPSAYRQAREGDDLTYAAHRQTSHGPEPWVPAEPLGWQDERPEWLRRVHRAFTSPEVSWWFDAEGAAYALADVLDGAAGRFRVLAGRCHERGRGAQRRRGVNR